MNKIQLRQIAKEVKIRAKSGCPDAVCAVTKHQGFVPSIEYFNKQVFSKDTKGYKQVRFNQFAYATIHLDEGSIGLLKADKCIISPMYTVFEVDEERVYPDYLYYQLKTPNAIKSYQYLGKGSVHRRKSISFDRLGDLKIYLPPLQEQKRIATILDKAVGIRIKREQAIKFIDDFLRAIFLDMFGDPVANPKEWEVKKFNAIGSLERGVSKHRPRNAPILLGGPYPLVQTGDVANSNGYIRSYKSTYSEFGLKQSKMWPCGTLCITIAANIAKTGILTFDACFPDSVVGFCPNGLSTTEYVQYWLSFLQKTLEDSAPESAQKNINLEILRNLNIPLPPINLQRKFSGRVEVVQGIKAKQTILSNSATTLFNCLTQRAFRGDL